MARHRDVTMQSLDRRPCRDIEITLRFKRSDRENTSTNGSCLTAQRLQIQVDGLAPSVRSARIPPQKPVSWTKSHIGKRRTEVA